MQNNRIVKRWLVVLLIALLFLFAFKVVQKIILPIIFGLLFAYIFSPVYRWFKKVFYGKNLPAIVLILILVFLVAIPIFYFAPLLVREIFDTYMFFQNYNFGKFFVRFLDRELAATVALNLNNFIGIFFSTSLNQFTNLLINLPSLALQFAIFLFTFFFAVRDYEEFGEYLSSLSPFSKSTELKFLKEFRGITDSIVFGQVLIGILQGLAVGAGLFFLGIPKALVLTFVAGLVSIIPVLGSWMVWFPVGISQIILGNSFEGIFMLLYGGLFISTIDNLVRPYLLSKKSNLPIALSIIGTIGGFYSFGIAGLVLGPLILAYCLIILEFYREGRLDELFKK